MIPSKLIFAPLVLQVALTLFMYVRLSVVKRRAAADGKVDEKRRALFDDAWPDEVIQVNNNIANQFEAPVLFYALVLALFGLEAVDVYAHVLAWAFALSRVAHAYVHVGANVVPIRRKLFTAGVVALMGLCALVVRAMLVSAA